MKNWHLADLDNRMYCNLEDGKKITMPRYYKDRVYSESQRNRVGFLTRVRMMQELEDQIARNPYYHSQMAEFIRSEFHKMYHNAEQGRTKI